jgi:hypothetical protein
MLNLNLLKKIALITIIAIGNLQFSYAIDPIAKPVKAKIKNKAKTVIIDEHDHDHERTNVAYSLTTSGNCVPGTVNRFSGSYHSNFYIGNNNGTNEVLAWGQNMAAYIGTGTGNITTPTSVSSSSYAGIPYEVRSSSSGSSTGYSALALRTSSKLYFFGTAANLTAITSMTGFGGAALTTAASDVTSKLPAGVAITDVAQMAVSQTAFAIVTNSGHVYILTKVQNLQGDTAAAGPAVWHHVTLTGGTTFLSGVTKFSLSSSGAFALTSTGKLYYWGAPANVAGVVNTTTSYNYAYDMSAQIPSGTNVTDLVCLGTKAPSSSTLFLLCSNNKVYGCGLNTNGVLGINNSTYTTNQATFQPVKGTDGTTDLTNIVRIDGNTEADIFTMGAMSSNGSIYGWGDSPAGMLGSNATINSSAVPKTVQLFSGTTTTNPPATGYWDFSIAGHFTIAFYHTETVGATQGVDQYWYLGHNTGGSIGDPNNSSQFILASAPAFLNSNGVTFDCSNTQPTITVTGTLSSFSSCSGLASANQTISVSGANLSANITITAPTGYEVSTSSGSGFGATATLTQSSGTVSATTVYIRIASTATGTPSGSISLSSTGATSVTVAASGTVNSLPTVTSTTGDSRTGAGTLILTGVASANATLDWYANSTGGSVLTGGTGTLSFTTPSISATTSYFAEARNTTSGCVSSARTLTTATINGSFAAGTIGSDQSICNGATPSGFTSIADASGGTGSISYQWQISTTSTTSGFSDISGATLATYVPLSGITQTTYYRRAASTATDAAIYSSAITVTVTALPTASSPIDNSRTGAGPVIISASASAGATLDWYANSTGGSVLSGGNGVLTFTTPSISTTTTYFAQARNTTTGCNSSSRIAVLATINGSFSAGAIGADQNICSGSTPSGLTSVTDASGGTGTKNYQWQSSTTSTTTGFTNIGSATSTTYNPTSLTTTTYYRRGVSTSTDSVVYSNAITITVNALPSSPTGTDGSSSSSGTVAISGSVNAGETIDWYSGATGGSPLSGGTGTTNFTTPSISSSTVYYAQARNTTTGCISANRTAVTASITANATPTITTSGTLSSFSSCIGFTSAEQSILVSGTDLVSDITVTAPSGYELALTSGGSFSNSVTLTHASATIAATPVYVRLKNDATTGVSGNITSTATNATSVDVSTGSATVNQIPSSPTGIDGSRTGSGTVAISGSVSTGETIDWYAGSTGGSPLTGGTGTTSFTTPSISSTTVYYAETRNTSTSCISANRTAVTATIQAPNNNGDTTAPAITHPISQNNDGTSSIKISENTAAVTTYTANETVTWSITGGSEQNLFSIDANTGALTFNNPLPLFASPTDSAPTNSYIVEITATDGNGNYSRQTLIVTISPFCGSWGN